MTREVKIPGQYIYYWRAEYLTWTEDPASQGNHEGGTLSASKTKPND